jgi:hypothetical protein
MRTETKAEVILDNAAPGQRDLLSGRTSGKRDRKVSQGILRENYSGMFRR